MVTKVSNVKIKNPHPSDLTRDDFETFLFRVYFGQDEDFVRSCINRAYLDFNRTLKGVGKMEKAIVIKDNAVGLLTSQLHSLSLLLANPITADGFDDWHKKTCEKLVNHYKENGFHFSVGQAQKWVNMTLKYMFTFGEQRIPGYKNALPFCHAPIDNIVLQQLKKYGFPTLNCPWSQLDDYDEYLGRQKWIRDKFGKSPLEIEFQLWLGKTIEE